MPVLDQVKNAAYTTAGVNLLVTDAIVGHEVRTPDRFEEHAATARKQATEALTDLRAYTEPRTDKLVEQLPENVAEFVTENRTRAWDFIGIDAPKTKAAATTAAMPASKKAPAKSKKATSGKTSAKKA